MTFFARLPRLRESARLIAGAFRTITCVLVLFALGTFGGLSGCASMVPQTMALRDTWPAGVPDRVELDAVPFFAQTEFQCGPAALATTLSFAGLRITPETLVDEVYLPGRQGSLQADMQAAPRRHGAVSYPLAPRLDDLLREVAAGNPVLILQDKGVGFISNWHYAVVAGFDYPAGELVLRSGETRRLPLPFTLFEYTWKKSGYWAMVTLPPDRIPATATETSYLAAILAMARVAGNTAATLAYKTFLQRWPGNTTAAIGLANRHYEQGELSAAEAVLRRAAALNPDSIPVLNNLAQTLSDQGRNDEALALIERTSGADGPFASAARDTHQLIVRRIAGSR